MKIENEIFIWSGYEWLTRERWGSIHPQKAWVWYDPDCIAEDDGVISLSIKYHPKTFNINGKEITSNYGTGIMVSEADFSFGIFEIEAILPTGTGMWPAFWLYSSEDWPPEIDVFEGYSGDANYKRETCLGRIKKYRIMSCIHFRPEWNVKSGEPVSPLTSHFNGHPATTWNRYGLNWMPDKLEFTINGKVVRTETKGIENLANYKMMVVINNHIAGDYKDYFTVGEPFKIRQFKFISYGMGNIV